MYLSKTTQNYDTISFQTRNRAMVRAQRSRDGMDGESAVGKNALLKTS